MRKVAVVFWSGSGNTEAMAAAVVDGAKSAGATVDLFTASEFSAAKASGYDSIAFGCPAMGSEQLEDGEFEPMFNDVKGSLGGKPIALFGSYGWGDGEWMRTWQKDCENYGLNVVADGVICTDAPSDDTNAELNHLGAMLA